MLARRPGRSRPESRGNTDANRRCFYLHSSQTAMDQRYVDTVRACKAILRNMERLEDTITEGQRMELNRLLYKVRDRLERFLEPEADEGLWIGER